MADSLSSAEILSGVCGVVACGDSHCVIAHTQYGLESSTDGLWCEIEDINLMRIDDRQRGPIHTEAVLHEWLHARFPDFKERVIRKLGEQLSALMHVPEVKRRSFD